MWQRLQLYSDANAVTVAAPAVAAAAMGQRQPCWARFSPALELGRGQMGSDSDRVGLAPVTAVFAFSQLDLYILLYPKLFWQ